MADTATDWIEHDGGPCPVAPGVRVYVRFEDGDECSDPTLAVWWGSNNYPEESNWQHRDGEAGIIAYRVVPA